MGYYPSAIPQTTIPFGIYCDTIRYLTQNKSPSEKKGFVSIIEDFPLSGWRDSNSRPPAPKAGALTGLRYTPKTILKAGEIMRINTIIQIIQFLHLKKYLIQL